MPKKIPKGVEAASSEEASVFVTKLQKKFQRRKRSAKETERLREYLAKYPAEYLRSIARRLLIDIVNGPRIRPKAPKRVRGKRTTGTGKPTTARSRPNSMKP
jgi:hypothetical protein